MEQKWHSLSYKALFSHLRTSEQGLSEKEAQARLEAFGKNELAQIKKDPWYFKLLSQFRSLPILLLLAAAAISLALGLTVDHDKLIDAAAILVAVLIAVLFSFWQEYKAEAALEALKKMVVLRSIVIRNGKEMEIDSASLVPGDIVVLSEGGRVPADIRLIEAVNLAAEQSALTGESRPSSKEVCVCKEKTPLPERRNMLFAGTSVVRGHGKGVVVATGMKTEFGKIVGFVVEEEEGETRLQQDISDLAKKLGYAGIALAALFFAIGIARGESATSMFVVAVTLAVAVIPEGLPTVLAITLALGVQKMAKKNAIVRKMPAVETLGSATVICTDKTGTITQNRMTVQELVFAEASYAIGQGRLDPAFLSKDPVLRKAVEVMALCNNAMLLSSEEGETLSGDPTETALLAAVASCGADARRIRESRRQVGEVPFDSERKMMSSIRLEGKRRIAYVKGAPERVLSRCNRVLLRNGERRLPPDLRRRMLSEAHALGEEGMRLLALAYREVPALSKYTSANTEARLVFVGLVAMEDPPRPEVAEAIATCRSAGIRVVMITGDSPATAKAIAAKVGLLERGKKIMDGAELEDMPDSELEKVLDQVSVFARVTPEQKYRIVSAFARKGEVVAVTGDGVNDAPAMKKAAIGVAMGVAGTDVTKEVADIVLTDDNFSSIVKAVKYGRTIFNNIKSFVRYQISTNVAALSLMFSAPAMGLPLPLLPLQLLWINIMIDGPPALALGMEPSWQLEMKKPPRNPKASFLSRNMVFSIILLGLVMASIALAVFSYYLAFNPQKAFTAVFTLFVFLQLFNALNCRSASESVFTRFAANIPLFAAIAVSLGLQMLIIYYEPLQSIFKTVPLGAEDLAAIAAAGFLIIVFEEMKKRFFKHTTAY
ncbi:MAG: calcium-translocating P-type ATPase, PMCA-type [Candidatus Micrarchaeota archaeon]|nr:calcium-translocating P-type ATPase, PMCA-type [Candidatus Micrarchaeota archaeon]